MSPRPWCLLFALFLFLNLTSTPEAQSPPLQSSSPGVASQSGQAGPRPRPSSLEQSLLEHPMCRCLPRGHVS